MIWTILAFAFLALISKPNCVKIITLAGAMVLRCLWLQVRGIHAKHNRIIDTPLEQMWFQTNNVLRSMVFEENDILFPQH